MQVITHYIAIATEVIYWQQLIFMEVNKGLEGHWTGKRVWFFMAYILPLSRTYIYLLSVTSALSSFLNLIIDERKQADFLFCPRFFLGLLFYGYMSDACSFNSRTWLLIPCYSEDWLVMNPPKRYIIAAAVIDEV